MKNGDKVGVIGAVGSGKTSLLLSILGEMPISDGTVLMEENMKVALAEQDPLIISGTIQENILFGLKYDESWYLEVCEACQLSDDFTQFPQRDLTLLGEMGHSLSGG